MSMNKDGIRLHKSNFSAIGQQIQPMLESGDCYRLIIKPWKEPGFTQFLRVSVGLQEDNNRVVQALSAVLGRPI